MRTITHWPSTLSADELEVGLIAGPDDQWWTSEFQAEMSDLSDVLADAGVDPAWSFPQGCCGVEVAEVFIKLSPIVGPVITAALGAYLHGKYARKVRLKLGDIEVEAATPEEVEELLARAQEFQQRNQPKIIP